MADTFIWGRKGSGKTLRACIDLWLDWLTGNQIWANTWLHPAFDYNPVTKQKGNLHIIDGVDLIRMLVESKDEPLSDDNQNKTLLLDEIKTQASARGFSSIINRHMVDFVSQARKRNFKIIYTDQILGAYDRWLRLMTDNIISCQPFVNKNDLGLSTNPEYPEPLYFRYYNLDLTQDNEIEPHITSFEISRKTSRMFYGLYKTGYMITPLELKYGEDISV